MRTLLLLLISCGYLFAQDFYGIATGDPHPDPFHFGVASGWNQIASSGAKWVRFDINENSILDANGNYLLDPEKLNFLKLANAAGLKVMAIVGAGPGFSISSLSNPWDIPTYAKACQLLVQNNSGLVNGIEVLNEPNNTLKSASAAQIAPETDWRNYLVDMTNAVHTSVAGAVPVIGCGIQGDDVLYCLSLNPKMDGVVYHPYDAGGTNNFPECAYEPTTLLPSLGGGAVDYEGWVKLVQGKTTIPIWETEFAEDNGSDSYVRSVWLARRFFMSLGLGVSHWFPFGWIFNACNTQEMVDWTNQDPRLPYYLMRHLETGGILSTLSIVSGKPTFSSTDSNFISANAKGYLLKGSAGTAAAVWQGNKSISWLAKVDALASVSFPYSGTDASGSYILNVVSWESVPASVTLANGVATVSNVDVGSEPVLIVLKPGSGPAPTPTPTPTPTPAPTPCPAYQSASQNANWNATSIGVTFNKPQLKGDTIVVKIQHNPAQKVTSVTDQVSGDAYSLTTPPGTLNPTTEVWTSSNVAASGWGNVITATFSASTYGSVIMVEEDHCVSVASSPSPTPTPTPAGIQPNLPSGVLPSGYALKWNQDFSSPQYSPFNQVSSVSTSGPPNSTWMAINGTANTNIYTKFDGTEGDPFSTSNGYLSIQANGNGTPNPYGGQLMSANWNTTSSGFSAINGYWEAKLNWPSPGSYRWPVWWLFGVGKDAQGNYGEVDICEFSQPNGNDDSALHTWPSNASPVGQGWSIPTGWHTFGCLVQPGEIRIYVDSALQWDFTGLSTAFSVPMMAILTNSFGPGFPGPSSGCVTNSLGVAYVRCWSL